MKAMVTPTKPFVILLLSWAFAGIGAVLGSILGNSAGKTGLFAGAVVGGILGVAAAVSTVTRLGWLPRVDRRGAFVGGACGFLIAAPFAATNLHTPITPVISCGLVGIGVLLGAGVARGWRHP
jgi:hypothetical protein